MRGLRVNIWGRWYYMDRPPQRAKSTGLVWHELLMWHDTSRFAGFLYAGNGVLEPCEPTESPAAKRRIKNLLDVSSLTGKLTHIVPREARIEELCRVHTSDYVAELKAMSASGGGDASLGAVGGETPFGPGGFAIAALAAGGILEAVDAIASGKVQNAYALVRPPGHHADASHGFGFCIFNHGALAARHAQEAHGFKRVAIVDWDVHHGNGAEHIFFHDPSVLTISIHQDGAYPDGSGGLDANGAGDGEGFNLNIPLPPGSGAGAYLAAMERVVAPALERFLPDLIIVACGFDAGAYDPMGRMMLHSEAFRQMTRTMMRCAGDLCGGRLLLTHEGGYHETTVPFFGVAVIEELSGLDSGIRDPFLPAINAFRFQALQPHQAQIIQEAQELAGNISPPVRAE